MSKSQRTINAEKNAVKNYANLPKATPKVRGPRGKYTTKYKTDEEREEARKASLRRSYYRRRYGRDTLEPELELTGVYRMTNGEIKEVFQPKQRNNHNKLDPFPEPVGGLMSNGVPLKKPTPPKNLLDVKEDAEWPKDDIISIGLGWHHYLESLSEAQFKLLYQKYPDIFESYLSRDRITALIMLLEIAHNDRTHWAESESEESND